MTPSMFTSAHFDVDGFLSDVAGCLNLSLGLGGSGIKDCCEAGAVSVTGDIAFILMSSSNFFNNSSVLKETFVGGFGAK